MGLERSAPLQDKIEDLLRSVAGDSGPVSSALEVV